MKDFVTLTLTYKEALIIRHSLESYGDKWRYAIRELSAISDFKDVSTEIKKRCAIEICELNKLRICTQRLWLKVSDEMYGSTPAPTHILSAFQDPKEND